MKLFEKLCLACATYWSFNKILNMTEKTNDFADYKMQKKRLEKFQGDKLQEADISILFYFFNMIRQHIH